MLSSIAYIRPSIAEEIKHLDHEEILETKNNNLVINTKEGKKRVAFDAVFK